MGLWFLPKEVTNEIIACFPGLTINLFIDVLLVKLYYLTNNKEVTLMADSIDVVDFGMLAKVAQYRTTTTSCGCPHWDMRLRLTGEHCKHMKYLPTVYRLMEALDHTHLRAFYSMQKIAKKAEEIL